MFNFLLMPIPCLQLQQYSTLAAWTCHATRRHGICTRTWRHLSTYMYNWKLRKPKALKHSFRLYLDFSGKMEAYMCILLWSIWSPNVIGSSWAIPRVMFQETKNKKHTNPKCNVSPSTCVYFLAVRVIISPKLVFQMYIVNNIADPIPIFVDFIKAEKF